MILATFDKKSKEDSLEKFMKTHGIQPIDKTTYDMNSGAIVVRKGFRARKGDRTEAPSGLPKKLRFR